MAWATHSTDRRSRHMPSFLAYAPVHFATMLAPSMAPRLVSAGLRDEPR